MKLRESIRTVKDIPQQIKGILYLTVMALIVSLIAVSMTLVGGHRAD